MQCGRLAWVVLPAITLPAYAGVYVTSPSSATGSTSGSATASSPVHFVAKATSPACAKGVAAMGIYTAPYTLAFAISGASLDTNLSLSAGTYNVAIQEWDHCGWSSKARLTLTVGGSGSPSARTFYNVQSQKGWSGYATVATELGNLLDLHLSRPGVSVVVDAGYQHSIAERQFDEEHLRWGHGAVGRRSLQQSHCWLFFFPGAA